MGKNKDDDIDEFGLDDLDADLDFGDWDSPEDGSGGAESRSPISQSIGTVKNAALGAVFPKSQRDRIILDALPEEATGAYEGYQDVNSAISDVYSHTKEELLKTQRTLKIQTRQLLPTMKKYLPESITSRVGDWAKTDDLFGQNYDPNTALMDRGLSEVFGALQEQNAASSEERAADAATEQNDRVESKIKDTVSNLKQDKLLEVMVGMAKDTNSSYTLQHSVTVNWQRKTLELNYRQLFALQEIAKLGQSRFERDTPALEAIVKNTALPDYAKEEFGEIQGAMFKRKIAEWVSPARFTEDFITKMQDNAKKKVTEALGEGRSLVDLIMGGMQEDDDDMGLEDNTTVAPDAQKNNLTQKGIGTATSYLAHKFINPQRDKLTAKIREKMSENEDVDKFFNKALYNFTNIPQIANSALSDERESAMGTFFKAMETMGITPEYRRENVSLESRDADRLDKVAKFDHRSYLTLNEVIPSWLSKINSSIRAGYGEDEDEVYDLTARSFVDKDVVAGRVRDYVGADENRERMRNRISEVTSIVDDGSMTEEMRKKVGAFIESRISEAKEFNVEALLENSDVLDRYMDWDTKDKFTEMLRDKSGGNADKLSNQVNGELNAMRGSVDSYQRRVNEMSAQYGEKALVDSGIIDYNREKDTLETNSDLTNIYKDVGKLKPKLPTTDEQRRMDARAKASQSYSPQGTHMASGLTAATITGGVDKSDLREILYGNTQTTLVELLQREQNEDPVVNVNQDAVITVLERLSSKEDISQILKHIKAMDEEGILTLSGGTIEVEDTDDSDTGKARKKKLKKLRKGRRAYRNDEHKGLFRRWGSLGADTLGSASDKLTSFAGGTKRALTGARTRIGLSNDRIKGIALSPFKTALNAARAAGNGAVAFGKGAIGARDIYGADGKVVLSGAQLKAGGYFKKVKDKLTPMETLEDLKGASVVYDSEGNIILSEEQLKNAGELSYYKDKKWWKITEVVGGGAGNLVNKVLNMPKNLLGGKDNLARKALRWFKELPDMYVGGKLVIRSNLMREGHYLCNGKPISKAEDIKGEVTDINGNVVISKTDFSKEGFEITDRWGRQVRTPLGRMAGRIGNVIGFVQNKISNIPENMMKAKEAIANSRPGDFLKRKVADPIKNAALWLPRKILGKGDPSDKKKGEGVGWFSQNKLFNLGGGKNKTNDILIRIYQLLNKRLNGEPEPEDWLGDYQSGASSKAAVEAVAKVKAKAAKFKDNRVAGIKARTERVRKRLDKDGKLSKYSPKNLKAGLVGRLKGMGKQKADLSSVKQHLIDRDNPTINLYRDKIAKELAKRQNSPLSRIRKTNPKDLLAKAQQVDVKSSLEGLREGMVKRGKDFGRRKDVKSAKRSTKDLITGRNRNLDTAAMSLLGNREGTRGHYRDQIARRIAELKGEEQDRMTTGFRGKVNSTLYGMKQKEQEPLKQRISKKFTGEDSVQNKILAKLTNMNEASQGMWFSTMRKTAEEGGMNANGLSGLTQRFGKRFQFGDKSAGKDWFKFMRRGKGGSETSEGVDAKGRKRKTKKKSSGIKWVDLLLTGMGALFGGLPGAIAGALLRPLGGMLAKVMGKGAMSLAAKALPAIGGVVASGATAIGGAAASAGGVIATGVAAVGGLPVIVGGALIAAVGWGIYKAATRKRAYYLDKMRLAQYGVQDYDLWSSDESAKVMYLEDNLKKFITFKKTGEATMRGLSAEQAVKLGVGYGIDKDNEKELIAFHSYLQTRFIPIYLNWYAAIRTLETAPALSDIGNASKVSKKEMQKTFDACKLTAASPYLQHAVDARKADRGWFKSATDWVGFTTNQLLSGEEVEEVQTEVGEEIAERVEERESRGMKGNTKIAASTSVAKQFSELDQTAHEARIENTITNVENFKSAYGGKKSDREINDNFVFSATHVGKKKAKLETLNALQGLRVKTYGLMNLNSVDVQTVLDLEAAVLPYIDKQNGTFTGKLDEVLAVFGAVGESEHAGKVRYWFRNRFLPVFTTYVLAVHRYLPSADPTKLILTGRYLYEIASLVVQTRVPINGMDTSVWFVRVLPFEGEVNDDPSSIVEELNTLKKLSKATELNVDTLPKDTTTTRFKADSTKYDGSAFAKTQENRIDESPGAVNSMKFPALTPSGAPASISTLKNAPVINQEAVDGDYRSISQGSQDIPDIINAASAVAGVNPLMMLTMAMTESSMNPNAKAPTSSAKGLFQFLNATWDEQMKRHGNKYGIPEGTSAYDPIANALMGAEFLKSNAKVSESIMNRPASAVDYYIPHFLGAGGARKFYRAMLKDPAAPAASVMTAEAKSNPNIFFRNGKPRSFAEVYQHFTSKISSNESHVRKYAPNAPAGGSESAKTTAMFKDVPGYNAERREDVVKAKASRDVAAVTSSSNSSAMASPSAIYDSATPSNVVDIRKPLEAKAKEFTASNPNATEADKETYVSEAAQKAATQLQAPVEISQRHDELLSAQVTLQQTMVDELIAIRKLLTIAMDDKTSSREFEQVKRDIESKPKKTLTIEHGQSLVNTKRVVNM